MFLSLAPNNFEIILQEFILCYAIADIIGSPEILKLFGNLVLNITECNIYFCYKNKAFNFAKIGLGISMSHRLWPFRTIEVSSRRGCPENFTFEKNLGPEIGWFNFLSGVRRSKEWASVAKIGHAFDLLCRRSIIISLNKSLFINDPHYDPELKAFPVNIANFKFPIYFYIFR